MTCDRDTGDWSKRRQVLLQELKESIAWINKRDPKSQSERMQGAKYAYKMCWKRLRKMGARLV